MTTLDPTTWPNPTGLAAVLDDALRTSDGPAARPPLTYLRRKPQRGMVAVYGSPGRGREMYTVSVDETAMGAVPTGAVDLGAGRWAGGDGGDAHLYEVPALGLTIERFPHDGKLHHLALAMTPTEGGALWRALEAACTGTLRSVEASALRYKPGDRCVIRYDLHSDGTGAGRAQTSVVGKLYGDAEQAREAHELMLRLWNLQGEQPWTPRPLGVAEPLPLVLAEDLGNARSSTPTLAGTEVIRFGRRQPVEALERAARALAELHTSSAALPPAPARTGTQEAGKAAKRATTLGRHVPELAEQTALVARALGEALEQEPCEQLVPSHGSYKPSQLLFREGAVFVVDFDQFCQADAALDVGYFLAYLRPPSLWYHREGTRRWFEEAAATFLRAYDAHLAERGVEAGVRAGIERRSHLYEAALLLKVAARRANRLHSPRPGEVRALLDEMRRCVAAAGH